MITDQELQELEAKVMAKYGIATEEQFNGGIIVAVCILLSAFCVALAVLINVIKGV